jgi:hypothetical protein
MARIKLYDAVGLFMWLIGLGVAIGAAFVGNMQMAYFGIALHLSGIVSSWVAANVEPRE